MRDPEPTRADAPEQRSAVAYGSYSFDLTSPAAARAALIQSDPAGTDSELVVVAGRGHAPV